MCALGFGAGLLGGREAHVRISTTVRRGFAHEPARAQLLLLAFWKEDKGQNQRVPAQGSEAVFGLAPSGSLLLASIMRVGCCYLPPRLVARSGFCVSPSLRLFAASRRSSLRPLVGSDLSRSKVRARSRKIARNRNAERIREPKGWQIGKPGASCVSVGTGSAEAVRGRCHRSCRSCAKYTVV